MSKHKLAFYVELLAGLNISKKNISTVPAAGELYNNMVEAMKFVYAARSHLGDPEFVGYVDSVRCSCFLWF